MSKNNVFHYNSKHIEIKYHYIKDMVQIGAVKLQYIVINKHIINVFPKSLSKAKFEYFKDKLGFVLIDVHHKRE